MSLPSANQKNKRLSLVCSLIITALATSNWVKAHELEHILVTANKREQPLASVDTSIQVVDSEQLSNAGVTQVAQLDKVFPGLRIQSRGNRAYPAISLRGISTPNFYSPTVQLYLDGVPQDMAFITQPLVNVERVELLKGPQATLYGGNAYAGVINIVTRAPAEQSKIGMSSQLATQNRKAALSMATKKSQQGWYADANWSWARELGEVTDISTNAQDIDGGKEYLIAARVGYAPEQSAFSARFNLAKDKLISDEEVYIRDTLLSEKHYVSLQQGPKGQLVREVDNFALNLNYQFDSINLSSVSAWQEREMERYLSGLNYPEDQTSFSQEFRLAYQSQQNETLFGVYFDDQEFSRHDPGYPGYFGPSVNQVDKTNVAIYGENRLNLSDALLFTAGMRWEKNTAKIDYARQNLGALAFNNERSFYSISPKLALGWQYNKHNRLFVNVSRGFKPGGFNHAVSNLADQTAYQAETSISSELGWRATMLQNSLQLNAALYLINSKDKQLYVGPLGRQVLTNAGDNQSYGMELAADWHINKQLIVNIAAVIGDSELERASSVQGASSIKTQMPYTSKQQVTVAMDYQFEQPLFAGDLSVSLSSHYYSKQYFDEANNLFQPSYALTDIALIWQAASNVKVRMFVDNLTDKIYRTSSFTFGPTDIRSNVGTGRNAGLSIMADF